MSQKLPVNNFEWAKELGKFNATKIMNYNEDSDKGYLHNRSRC